MTWRSTLLAIVLLVAGFSLPAPASADPCEDVVSEPIECMDEESSDADPAAAERTDAGLSATGPLSGEACPSILGAIDCVDREATAALDLAEKNRQRADSLSTTYVEGLCGGEDPTACADGPSWPICFEYLCFP